MVHLVGAGPGDPGLLTLRGAEVLQRADVVLYDGLSNESILQHAPQAEQICVGKHGRSRIWKQEEINQEILRHARSGKNVVRLKGGDPAVFARTAEEVDALRAAGISFEIVPGITAALAAGSFAGIPITHRGIASAVALVTGHEEPNKSSPSLDWNALARFPGTLVIYMGVTTVGVWTKALLDAGKPADTPAAILRRCSLPDQKSVVCRLDQVADLLTPATKMRPPVIVIVGPVANLAHQGCWFTERPLFGRKVLVTRAEDQVDELAGPLADFGAEILSQPAITISPPANPEPLRNAIRELAKFDWIAFTSRNSIQSFFEELHRQRRDARALGSTKIAVVGPRTAEKLADYQLFPDLISDASTGEGLALQLNRSSARPLQILWPSASRASATFGEELQSGGHFVTRVTAYEHADVQQADSIISDQMAGATIDWTTVTSSAIARSLVGLFGDSLRSTKLVSLSPKTTKTLEQMGFSPKIEAEYPTMQSLTEAIVRYESGPQSERCE